jgi:hypothetical protein
MCKLDCHSRLPSVDNPTARLGSITAGSEVIPLLSPCTFHTQHNPSEKLTQSKQAQ